MRKILSTQRDYSMRMRAACALAAMAALTAFAGAQYPGHIENAKKTAPPVRSIAVLEWTGEKGKPSASRLIPISVFDGEVYQPGGLYLAKPEPFALQPGTEYVLQDAGIAKGLFDIGRAQDVQGYWFGYGAWKPMTTPAKRVKSKPSVHPPRVVNDANDGRPSFKRRNSDTSQDSSADASKDASKDSSAAKDSSTSPTASSHSSAGDPDRPTLRKRADSSSDATKASADTSTPETPIGGDDPDRPHIAHGQQTPTDSAPAELTGTPPDLQQMIAVSDATDRDAHPFVYLWADPADGLKMQQAMERAAADAIVAAGQPAKPAAAKTRPRSAPVPAVRRKAAAMPPAPKPVFTNEHFKAYELTYSGGATLVFSAEMTDKAGKVQYVTLIAQPDFSGVPKVLFKSVTDDDHLDQKRKMRLVDAVDARANNRGDLVFELRSLHDREFVIYRVAGGVAEQVFTTGSLNNSQS